jgi:hypothetical protein
MTDQKLISNPNPNPNSNTYLISTLPHNLDLNFPGEYTPMVNEGLGKEIRVRRLGLKG